MLKALINTAKLTFAPPLSSFVRFVSPSVNLHLSFTTVTLFAELMSSHPNMVSFSLCLRPMMDCFLSEKNELGGFERGA